MPWAARASEGGLFDGPPAEHASDEDAPDEGTPEGASRDELDEPAAADPES